MRGPARPPAVPQVAPLLRREGRVLQMRQPVAGTARTTAPLSYRIRWRVPMAKRIRTKTSGDTDKTDFYAGGLVFAATVATVAALYAIGM
jgi:hypothetical protein